MKYDGRGKFDRSEFLQSLRAHGDGLELVFYILPNNALPRYAAVKRACTLELKSRKSSLTHTYLFCIIFLMPL